MASNLETLLLSQISWLNLPLPEIEWRFAAELVGREKGMRKRLKERGLKDWRFDMAWPQLMFAVEVEGITPQGGRHQRIKGFMDDIEKYHAAIEMGWTVYRTTGHLIANGKAVQLINKILMDEINAGNEANKNLH